MLHRFLLRAWRKKARPLWYKLSGKNQRALLTLFDAYEPTGERDFTITRSVPQSVTFAKDIFPKIREAADEWLAANPGAGTLCVLDVGGATGAGTDYIRAQLQIHIARAHPERDVRVSMTMLDNSAEYGEWCGRFHPKVRFLKADIFRHGEKYDFVVCSAVIEHVEEPLAFVGRMQGMARWRLFVYAPYNERPLSDYGHINTIDDGFLAQLGAALTFVDSRAWRRKGGMVLAVLPGRA